MRKIALNELLPYILPSLPYAALHLLAFYAAAPGLLPLVVDTALYAGLIAVAGVVLRGLLLYGKQENLSLKQRMGNLLLLGALLVALIASVAYGAAYGLFGEEAGRQYLPLLPAKAALVFLFYIVMLQSIENKRWEKAAREEDLPSAPEEKNAAGEPVEPLERITVKTGAKIDIVPVDDILYVASYGDYVYLHTLEKRYLKEQTMKYFEERLPPASFARVHRSYIVHLKSISKIERYEKQSRQLILKNGERLKVSPSGYRIVKAKLGI